MKVGAGIRVLSTLTVTFDPTKTGTRTAQIQISDHGGGSPQTVPLTGTGD